MSHGSEAAPDRHDVALALALPRLALGVGMATRGVTRLAALPAFADGMVGQFAATPLPAVLVRVFGLAVPAVEAVVGVLLVLGLALRPALAISGLLMVPLVFGMTLRREYATVAQQLLYALLFALLLAGRRWDALSLDAWRARRRAAPPSARE